MDFIKGVTVWEIGVLYVRTYMHPKELDKHHTYVKPNVESLKIIVKKLIFSKVAEFEVSVSDIFCIFLLIWTRFEKILLTSSPLYFHLIHNPWLFQDYMKISLTDICIYQNSLHSSKYMFKVHIRNARTMWKYVES